MQSERDDSRTGLTYCLKWALLVLITFCMAAGPTGCGGCLLCGADVEMDTSVKTGQISVVMQGFSTPASPAYISVAYEGSCTQGEGDSGRTSFHISQTYEVTSSGVNPAPQHERVGLKPGNWTVTARQGNWSAAGSGRVEKEKTTSFTFTLNRSNVQVR